MSEQRRLSTRPGEQGPGTAGAQSASGSPTEDALRRQANGGPPGAARPSASSSPQSTSAPISFATFSPIVPAGASPTVVAAAAAAAARGAPQASSRAPTRSPGPATTAAGAGAASPRNEDETNARRNEQVVRNLGSITNGNRRSRTGSRAAMGEGERVRQEELDLIYRFRKEYHERPPRVYVGTKKHSRPLIVSSHVMDRSDFAQPLFYYCRRVATGSRSDKGAAATMTTCSPMFVPVGGCCCPSRAYHYYRREAAHSLESERAAGAVQAEVKRTVHKNPLEQGTTSQVWARDEQRNLDNDAYYAYPASLQGNTSVLHDGHSARKPGGFYYYDDFTVVEGGEPWDNATCCFWLKRLCCLRCSIAQQINLLFKEAEYRQHAPPALGPYNEVWNNNNYILESTTSDDDISVPSAVLLRRASSTAGVDGNTPRDYADSAVNAESGSQMLAAQGGTGPVVHGYAFADPRTGVERLREVPSPYERSKSKCARCCSSFWCCACRSGDSYLQTLLSIVCLDVASLFCCGTGCLLSPVMCLFCNHNNSFGGLGSCLCNARARYLVRARYRIEGTLFEDALISCCFLGCAVDQQGSEMLLHRVYTESPTGYGLGCGCCSRSKRGNRAVHDWGDETMAPEML